MGNDSDGSASFASPPCFAHELSLGDNGCFPLDPVAASDVACWRKPERERLIAARRAIPAEERKRLAEEVAAELERLIQPKRGITVSLYWPIRGEINLRHWMHEAQANGARVALPVVEAMGRPLVFREWTPAGRMVRGVWNIPIPADGALLRPDVTVAPLIGFDADCYRLGYGGGFFDRTFATLLPRPLIIGVGHPSAAISTIYPQPHDIPMDVIVTGASRVIRRERDE